MSIQLDADLRKVAGKGVTRAIRNKNNIPAVIYGGKKDPVAIELDGRNFEMLIKKPGLRTKLFEISVSSNKENAMLVDIQYHPVSDRVVHVDFKRIDVKSPVSVVVPVEIINTEISKGIKLGGVLNFAVRKVSITGLIENIPEKIIIDALDLNIGDSVHGSDLKLPQGITLGLHQAELAFATIGGKMAEEVDQKKASSSAPADKKAPAKK